MSTNLQLIGFFGTKRPINCKIVGSWLFPTDIIYAYIDLCMSTILEFVDFPGLASSCFMIVNLLYRRVISVNSGDCEEYCFKNNGGHNCLLWRRVGGVSTNVALIIFTESLKPHNHATNIFKTLGKNISDKSIAC